MVGDAILKAVRAVPNYNIEKFDNPFGYFSKVIERCFLQRIASEKRRRQGLDKLIMVHDIFSVGSHDEGSFTKDQLIGDFQFDSSGD